METKNAKKKAQIKAFVSLQKQKKPNYKKESDLTKYYRTKIK